MQPQAIKTLREEREFRAAANATEGAAGYGFHGLPNPNEYKEADSDSLALDTIKQMYSYLQYINDRLDGGSNAEKLLQKIRKQILTYKNEHPEQFEEFEDAAAAAA